MRLIEFVHDRTRDEHAPVRDHHLPSRREIFSVTPTPG
jgi:hypothetical protein